MTHLSRREAVSPSLTVLTEGEGRMAVSEETVGGAGLNDSKRGGRGRKALRRVVS
jgi:hypothetical protein